MADNSTDPLLLLVRSLTAGEKNHFLRSVTKGGDNKYLVLFNSIEKLPEATEKAIQVEYIRKAGATGQYARIKAYLYHRLIEALADFHTKHLARAEIHELLKQAEVLLLKQLRGPLREILRRVRQLAEESEAYDLMPEIIWREKTSIPIDLPPDEIYPIIKRLNKDLFASLDMIHELHEIGDVSFLLAIETNNEYRYTAEEYRKRLDTIIAQPAFHKELTAFTTQRGRISALSMRAFYWLAINDYEAFLVEAEKLFSILRASPEVASEHYLRYSNNLTNVIVALHLLRRPEEAFSYLSEFERLLAMLSNLGFSEKYNPLYVMYILAKARILFAVGKYKEVIELLPQFQEIESAVAWSTATSWRRHQFFVLLTGAFLLDNQPKAASRFLVKALQDDQQRKRTFGDELRQLELAICYELGDEDRMENLLNSIRRKYQKLDPQKAISGAQAYEMACLAGWNELVQHRNGKSHKNNQHLFRQLHHELTTQRKGQHEHDERTRFVFESWLLRMAEL